MKHEDVLRMLFPAELGGDYDMDLAIEGARLDALGEVVDQLRDEMFPHTAVETLPDWERMLGITPEEGDTTQTRQARALAAWRARGSLSLPHWESLADALGHEISVTSYSPSICGVAVCGDELTSAAARFLCKVEVTNASEQDPFFETLIRRFTPPWADVEFHYTGGA